MSNEIAQPLTHRLFWTWDHSMDWAPTDHGIQEYGCDNDYYKRPGCFLQDYRALVDFCAAHHFTGIVVYGFLRDCHGGVEAAQELCRYGHDKGVRIIPGIGVNSYGGVYWQGNHEFNLAHWIERHPELEAVRAPRILHSPTACPSKKANRQWMLDAVQWLCETCEIGGINYETGDYGVCQCDECRSHSSRDQHWSLADMAELLPPLVDGALRVRPDLLPVCECYFDNVLDTAAVAGLRALPERAVLQFTINRAYWPRFQREMTAEKAAELPPQHKIIRTHMGSQWNAERHLFVAPTFADLTRQVAAAGLQGVTIFGEVSAWRPANEMNYLSVAAFADDPQLTWPEFVMRDLAPLLGGEELAATYLRLLQKERAGDQDLELARSVLRRAPEPAYRRWLWLAGEMHRRVYNTPRV